MKPRATHRELPVNDRIFSIQTSAGPVAFRVPGRRAGRPISVLGRDDPAMLGVIIGLAWMHTTLDLEAIPPTCRADVEEWQAYGDAVLDELDDADWYPAEVDGVAGLLFAEWAAYMQVHAEARETADFFEVTTGTLRSRRSTLNSVTLAAVDSAS